jgi:hypothetical protein
MDSGSRGYYFRLLIALDNSKDANNGLHAIEGNMGSNNYRNMNVAGTLYMKVNQYTSLYVYTNGDNSWTLHSESGWGCHLLGTKIGFHADMTKDMSFKTGWSTVGNWRTSGASTLYAMGGGASMAGYNAPSDGFYVCSAQMRYDSASGTYFSLIIAINNARDASNGLHAISGSRDSSNYRDMTVAGTVKLMGGDSVSVHVYSSSDNSWKVNHESGVCMCDLVAGSDCVCRWTGFVTQGHGHVIDCGLLCVSCHLCESSFLRKLRIHVFPDASKNVVCLLVVLPRIWLPQAGVF